MTEQNRGPLNLVLIGGSSGSFVIFEQILKLATRPLPCAVIFVLHRGKSSMANFPFLFKAKTKVRMEEPQHLDPVENDCIYFAVPDYHLLIGPDKRFYLDDTDKDFFSRPSIDATLISALQSGINIRAAMLFSGASQDGALGLKLIAEKGFATYVQNPDFAEVPRMPAEALKQYGRHHILDDKTIFEEIRSVLYSYST
ncbi:chemotaxis protein CheB [Dyadobacter sp. CY356]|uniref:chemotaxis protein CheB n=1 Tax=Dyadobacter sp. CY356 TaxID=2906442 RepID=UPI001F474DBE|nr:chemotaxis protein CheB [Dyadobacter sp. CY356]MCF0055622.1 chemotaxis protein CheB [Dyadobacter sp. CY356]